MDLNPAILQELLNEDLDLPSKSLLQQFKREVLRVSLLKKYVPKDAAPLLHTEAIDKFVALNAEIANFQLSEQFKTSQLATQWKACIYDAVMSDEFQACTVTLAKACNNGYTGPGSSRMSNDTSFFTKMFASPLSSTSKSLRDLLTYYLCRMVSGRRNSARKLWKRYSIR